MAEVGKVYYFVVSPWLHLIARLEAITGREAGGVGPGLFVYSCRRDWTSFFEEGLGADTVYKRFPPGDISWSAAFDWPHPFEEEELAQWWSKISRGGAH